MGTDNTTRGDLAETLRALTEQVAALTARLAAVEGQATPEAEPPATPGQPAAAPAATERPATSGTGGGLDEETLLVISAAIAAFLGKKATIRQIRLVGSPAWSRQGRVNIHASHAFARSGAAS